MAHSTGSIHVPRTPAELRDFLGNGTDVARVEFFSDAVFAIAMTLLALEIRVPELPHNAPDADIWRALGGLGRMLFSYGLSFILVGTHWMRHHALFRLIRRHDPALMIINLFGLMLVTLVPIPTALYGQHITSVAAVALFFGFHALASLVWVVMWMYASSGHRLVAEDLPRDVIRHVTLMQSVPVVAMAGALAGVLTLGPQFAAFGILPGAVVLRGFIRRSEQRSRVAA